MKATNFEPKNVTDKPENDNEYNNTLKESLPCETSPVRAVSIHTSLTTGRLVYSILQLLVHITMSTEHVGNTGLRAKVYK